MLSPDTRTLAHLEPTLRRVMIVDGNQASARLLAELLKGAGAREVVFEVDEKQAMEVASKYEPTLLFVDRAGPRFDGESLARRVRRSPLECRRSPIIMVSADATATNIKGARDAGVHEFMVKPFTTGDLLRRVVNVATKPRPWVEAVGYVGPDRRRFNSGEYAGPRKRSEETRADRDNGNGEALSQIRKILIAALDQFDVDPAQARRAILAQADAAKVLAVSAANSRLALIAAELSRVASTPHATLAELSIPASGVLEAIVRAETAGKAA